MGGFQAVLTSMSFRKFTKLVKQTYLIALAVEVLVMKVNVTILGLAGDVSLLPDISVDLLGTIEGNC